MSAVSIRVSDASHVSAARLGVQKLARDVGFDDTRGGRVALVVTEAVTNMVRHANGGTLAARALARADALGVEILAIDSGAGMASFESSARDGHSTAGSAGTGLGAIRRLSDEFDVYTQPGAGTILRMAVWAAPGAAPAAAMRYEVGAIAVPKAGETACGDAWGIECDPAGATLLVADGLGHGQDAARAGGLAVEALRATGAPRRPADVVALAHLRLRPTRGAAVAVVRHERAAGEAVFAGVGNVCASILAPGTRRAMVSRNGIVGHNVGRVEEYRYPWPDGALLVAHTDGLESRWSLDGFPGLARCHPSIIAGLLYRQHARGRDDVCVVVARAA